MFAGGGGWRFVVAGIAPQAISREPTQLASAAAQRMHDLDPVPLAERVGGMQAAWNDLAVDLDRDPAFGQAFSCEQHRQGGVGSQFERLAIQFDSQARIVTDP